MRTFAVSLGSTLWGHVDGDVVRKVSFECTECGGDENDQPKILLGTLRLFGVAAGFEWQEQGLVCLPFDEHATIERRLLGMARADALAELEKYPPIEFKILSCYRMDETGRLIEGPIDGVATTARRAKNVEAVEEPPTV